MYIKMSISADVILAEALSRFIKYGEPKGSREGCLYELIDLQFYIYIYGHWRWDVACGLAL